MNLTPILSVLLADEPAAHERLANVLRRRAPGGFSVSLATGEERGMVRATVVLGGSWKEAEECRLQIEKMVDVVEATLLDDYLGAQLVVFRLTHFEHTAEALSALERVGARLLRHDDSEIVAQLGDRPEKVEAALDGFRRLGRLTALRSGLVAMAV